MADFIVPLRPEKIWLRKEFLFDDEHSHGQFVRSVLISAKAIPGRALEFQVLTETGILRDKLPIEAICHIKGSKRRPTHELELWNAFSKRMTVVELPMLNRVQVFNKKQQLEWCTYWHTFDFCLDNNGYDRSVAEQPDEHKCLHFMACDDGNFMLQPNNRCIWTDPSFITKPFKHEGYKVSTSVVDVEMGDVWRTSDDDKQYYKVESNE